MAFTRYQQLARKLLREPSKKTRFDIGIAKDLPVAYKKFWREWKVLKPTSVHYISPHYTWQRNELTGEIKPANNILMKTKYSSQISQGLFTNGTVKKELNRKNLTRQKVVHNSDLKLKRTVVKSEVLNTYLSVTVSEKTMKIIRDHYGFDHYLLKTLACNLGSLHALKLKKKILIELKNGCPRLANNPQKQKDIYEKYKIYLEPYTQEDIEWYGLTWIEALDKISKIKAEQNNSIKIENIFREDIVGKLNSTTAEILKHDLSTELTASWLSKLNLLGKNDEA